MLLKLVTRAIWERPTDLHSSYSVHLCVATWCGDNQGLRGSLNIHVSPGFSWKEVNSCSTTLFFSRLHPPRLLILLYSTPLTMFATLRSSVARTSARVIISRVSTRAFGRN